MKVNGKIEQGAFSNMRELFRQFSMLEGEQVTVSVNKRKPPGTQQQNNYLWGVVYKTISAFTGYTEEDLHYRVEPILELRMYEDEKGIKFVKSWASMSMEERAKYIEKVKLWAWHELNLFIPEPQ